MKIKIKNVRKTQKRPDGPGVEDLVSSGPVDDLAVKELEARAKKRLLDFGAEFTKSQETPPKTIRMLCDEIKLQAQKCLITLQSARQPSYKSYIEYFTRVEFTGGIPRHETAANIIQYCFLDPRLPAEVLKFANTYAGYIYQAAVEGALESAKDYVDIVKHLSETITLDPNKNVAFIRVFGELHQSLMSVSRVPSVSFYMQCFANVLLSIGMADPSQQPEKLIALTSLTCNEEATRKSRWFLNMAATLNGLDHLNSQLRILNNYSTFKLRQEIIHEINEPQASFSNFMN